MDTQILDLFEQTLRVLIIVCVPTLLIPLGALIGSLMLGMLGIRDEGLQYAVRVLVLALVIIAFGASATDSFVELMQVALR